MYVTVILFYFLVYQMWHRIYSFFVVLNLLLKCRYFISDHNLLVFSRLSGLIEFLFCFYDLFFFLRFIVLRWVIFKMKAPSSAIAFKHIINLLYSFIKFRLLERQSIKSKITFNFTKHLFLSLCILLTYLVLSHFISSTRCCMVRLKYFSVFSLRFRLCFNFIFFCWRKPELTILRDRYMIRQRRQW